MKYTAIIEKAPNNYAAYVPDLPGCVATGYTEAEVLEEISDAIGFHIESLIDHGEPVPVPQTVATSVDVGLARTSGRSTGASPKSAHRGSPRTAST